jgi:hypothetical protein
VQLFLSVIPRSAAADKKIYVACDVRALQHIRILLLNGVTGYALRRISILLQRLVEGKFMSAFVCAQKP